MENTNVNATETTTEAVSAAAQENAPAAEPGKAVSHLIYEVIVVGSKLLQALTTVNVLESNYFAFEAAPSKKVIVAGEERIINVFNVSRTTEEGKGMTAPFLCLCSIFNILEDGTKEPVKTVKKSELQAFFSAKEVMNFASCLVNGNEKVKFTVCPAGNEEKGVKPYCTAEVITEGNENFLSGKLPIPLLPRESVKFYRATKEELIGGVELDVSGTKEIQKAIAVASDATSKGTAYDSVAVHFGAEEFKWVVTTGKKLCIGRFDKVKLIPETTGKFWLIKCADFKMAASVMRPGAKLAICLMGEKKTEEKTLESGEKVTAETNVPKRFVFRYAVPDTLAGVEGEIQMEVKAFCPTYMEAKEGSYFDMVRTAATRADKFNPVSMKFERDDMKRACKLLNIDGNAHATVRLKCRNGNDIEMERSDNPEMRITIKGKVTVTGIHEEGKEPEREDVGFPAKDMETMLSALTLRQVLDASGNATGQLEPVSMDVNDGCYRFGNVARGVILGFTRVMLTAAKEQEGQTAAGSKN